MNNYFDHIAKENILKGAKGATLERIAKVEEKLKVKFAKDYVEFLMKVGACIYNGHEIVGICDYSDMCVENLTLIERQLLKESNQCLYAIENTHIDGIIIWQNSEGQILQTAPNAKQITICNSLEEYIKM